MKRHLYRRKCLDLTTCVSGHDHGYFFIEIHQLLEQAGGIERLVEIGSGTQYLYTTAVVPFFAELVYCR